MAWHLHGERPSWPWQIGWLIAIWSGSVLVLGVFAFAFRLLMKLAGLTAG